MARSRRRRRLSLIAMKAGLAVVVSALAVTACSSADTDQTKRRIRSWPNPVADGSSTSAHPRQCWAPPQPRSTRPPRPQCRRGPVRLLKAWAADNVTVNAVAPAVKTPGEARLREFLGPAASRLDAQMKAAIPLDGRMGDAEHDLGSVPAFLAGEGSRFMTGQLLIVDGGMLMLGA